MPLIFPIQLSCMLSSLFHARVSTIIKHERIAAISNHVLSLQILSASPACTNNHFRRSVEEGAPDE